MDYNQQYQIHYPYYQSSSPQTDSATTQVPAQVAAGQTIGYGYFQQQGDTRSLQQSPGPQSYQMISSSLLALDQHLGSPASVHRVMAAPATQSVVQQPQQKQPQQQQQQQQKQHNQQSSTSPYFTGSSNVQSSAGPNYPTSNYSHDNFEYNNVYQSQGGSQQRTNPDSVTVSAFRDVRKDQHQSCPSAVLNVNDITQMNNMNLGSRSIPSGVNSSTSRAVTQGSHPNNLNFSSKFANRRTATRPLVSSSMLHTSGGVTSGSNDVPGASVRGNKYNDDSSNFVAAIGADAQQLKTPVALVVDLAKRQSLQVGYEKTEEKIVNSITNTRAFTVCLHLGNEHHFGTGNTIQQAQQNAAQEALRSSLYLSSTTRPFRPLERRKPNSHLQNAAAKQEAVSNNNPNTQSSIPSNREASMTPTVELNALAMKYRLRVIYDDSHVKKPTTFVHGRQTQTTVFVSNCKIANHLFSGEASTRKDARQASAKAALEVMKQKSPDELLAVGIGTPPNLQSEVSQVYDFAARRGLAVKFTVDVETPLPEQTFISVVSLSGGASSGGGSGSSENELRAIGRGRSKKEAKHKACCEMLQTIRQLPVTSLPSSAVKSVVSPLDSSTSIVEAIRGRAIGTRPARGISQVVHSKQQPDYSDPNYGIELNPVSRLYQILQGKKNGILPVFTEETSSEVANSSSKSSDEKGTASGEDDKEEKPPTPPSIDPSTSYSVKPTGEGKYVLLLHPSVGTAPMEAASQRQKKVKFSIRCTCGNATVVGQGSNSKSAKTAAVIEMLKLLNYNIPPPPPVSEENDEDEGSNAKRKERSKKRRKLKKSSEIDDQKNEDEVTEANANNVQLFFHPALFAPPSTGSSTGQPGLLNAHDLIDPKRTGSGTTLEDIITIAGKVKSLKQGEEILKVVEEVISEKVPDFTRNLGVDLNSAQVTEAPNFFKLSLLCSLAGKTPSVTHISNTPSAHLVFVDLANAKFCGEGATHFEALESVASRLVDSISNSPLPSVLAAPPIILTEEDLAIKTEEFPPTVAEVLPTALIVNKDEDDSDGEGEKAEAEEDRNGGDEEKKEANQEVDREGEVKSKTSKDSCNSEETIS